MARQQLQTLFPDSAVTHRGFQVTRRPFGQVSVLCPCSDIVRFREEDRPKAVTPGERLGATFDDIVPRSRPSRDTIAELCQPA